MKNSDRKTAAGATTPAKITPEAGPAVLTDRAIYERVILREIPSATRFVWIATANLKDLHVHRAGRMVPFLETLSCLAGNGVSLRLLHAAEPGPAFRRDFDRYPNLVDGLEMMLCPRVHFKTVIVDARFAYMGSANLTGAGMGAKGDHHRNFETGIATCDLALVQALAAQFDEIWMGARCGPCRRKAHCAFYPEIGP